jgi:hypothetical protein
MVPRRLCRIPVSFLFVASLGFLAGCAEPSETAPDESPEPAESIGPSAGVVVERVGEADPDARYLFYLHPKVVEDQGLPAVHPEWGEYRYQEILDRLAGFGFTVVSEVRGKDASSGEWAERIAGQVQTLLAGGVPPERITVVGASKGAFIAALVSHRVETPGVRYVILAMCDAETVAWMLEQGYALHGDVLALRDADDVPEFAGTCEPLYQASPDIGRHDGLVVEVGTGHAILFQPLDEWVLPTVEWARGER